MPSARPSKCLHAQGQAGLKASQQGSPLQARKRWTPGLQGQPSAGDQLPSTSSAPPGAPSPWLTCSSTAHNHFHPQENPQPRARHLLPAAKKSYLQLHPPTELGRTSHGYQRANPSPTATHHGSEPPGLLNTITTTTSLRTHPACLPRGPFIAGRAGLSAKGLPPLALSSCRHPLAKGSGVSAPGGIAVWGNQGALKDLHLQTRGVWSFFGF